MTWLYRPHCITVYEMLLWINEILTFSVLFLIWCLLLRACPCWLKKKRSQKKKRKDCLLKVTFFLQCMYIHDSQSRIVAVRSFQGVDFNHNIQQFFSTSRFIDNKKKCWITGSQKWAPPPPHPSPNSLFKYSVWANIFKHFSCILCMLVYLRRFAPGQ